MKGIGTTPKYRLAPVEHGPPLGPTAARRGLAAR
jgi:hypothetical protein